MKIKYNHNPLMRVELEIRFPIILQIENDFDSLTNFQSKIRNEYPRVTIDGISNDVNEINSTNFDNAIGTPKNTRTTFLFENKEKTWRIFMMSDRLSIATEKYESWEDIKSKFAPVLQSFVSVYKPVVIDKISLRYVDAIIQSEYGLNDAWSDLLAPHVIGSCGCPLGNVVATEVKSIIMFDDVQLVLRAGLGTVKKYNEEPKDAFLMNTDYSVEGNIAFDEFDYQSNKVHEHAWSFFDSCLKDKMRQAMEPIGV